MWRTRPSASSVSRLRYVEATSERGTRPSKPPASSSTVAGPSAAKSASSTRRRAAETRRPPARSAATALSMVATPRGRSVRAGVIGRPPGGPGAGRNGASSISPRAPPSRRGGRWERVRARRTCGSFARANRRHSALRASASPSDGGGRDRPASDPNATRLQLGGELRSAGAAAVRARPEQRDLARGERVAAARLDPRAEVAERVVVHVADRAAALAHEVMVRVLVRGLVEDAVAAEVGAERQAGLDEHVERPVHGRRGHARDLRAHALADLARAQVPVGLRGEDLPDHAALSGEAP